MGPESRSTNRVADSQTVRQSDPAGRQSDPAGRQSDPAGRQSDNRYPGSRQSYKNPEIQNHFCRSLRDPSQGPIKILLNEMLSNYLPFPSDSVPIASDCLTVCLPGLTV